MADRGLLAAHRVAEFAEWAIKQGFKSEAVKGEYEILRIRDRNNSPIIFFKRAGDREHVTVQGGRGYALVRRFISATKA